MESATTNLSEITADFGRLWDGEALAHRDVRELFVDQASVVTPESVELQVGTEVDTLLLYPAPTNEQVPGLKGLLEYIDARQTGGFVNKHYSLKRKHFTLQEGPLQQVQQHTQRTHKHEQRISESYHSYQKTVRKSSLILLEVCAPVLLVRQTRNTRVTRPIYIFAS